MEQEFTRRFLYELMKDCQETSIDEKLQSMENRIADITNCPEDQRNTLSRSLRYFKSDVKKRWETAYRKEERFQQQNSEWLSNVVKVPTFNTSTPGPGRPKKDFEDASERSKRRKTEDLRKWSPSEIAYAASMSQRASGNTAAAEIIQKVTETPTKAEEIKKTLAMAEKYRVVKKTPEQALGIFVDADLTRKQYELIQASSKDIYPCYSLIKRAKQDCYPKEDSICVTQTMVEIKLQALLDHTSIRLCKYLEDVIKSLPADEKDTLILLTKWGCDGSQQVQFKQTFHNLSDSDSNIFQSSCVPLQLISNVNEKKRIVWQNPTPSSTRFCRPIRMRFVHETTDVTLEEIQHIEHQIKSLNMTDVTIDDGTVKIKHEVLFTMVDGKVCNAATGTSSTLRCYICGRTSKDFNKLETSFSENPEALKFGLSTLHTRIRFFESLLHLSYKLPIKKWQARGEEEKRIVADTKIQIQQRFREEMGLIVDVPKQGFGNTNDGNTSRRFFSNPETASQITGINENLITRLKVLLEVISSGHTIDVEKFDAYAKETARFYVTLYGWHPMTPTLHKVLIHGAAVIKHAVLPIGQLSEEAAEARNKHIRIYRTMFSRKCSREACNRDVVNRLLLSSDPFLSCSRPKAHKKSKTFSSETLQLLLPLFDNLNLNNCDNDGNINIEEISEEADLVGSQESEDSD